MFVENHRDWCRLREYASRGPGENRNLAQDPRHARTVRDMKALLAQVKNYPPPLA